MEAGDSCVRGPAWLSSIVEGIAPEHFCYFAVKLDMKTLQGFFTVYSSLVLFRHPSGLAATFKRRSSRASNTP